MKTLKEVRTGRLYHYIHEEVSQYARHSQHSLSRILYKRTGDGKEGWLSSDNIRDWVKSGLVEIVEELEPHELRIINARN